MKNRIKIKSKTVVILSVLLVILVLVGLCVWYIAQQIP
ncbi:MAG: preprotein translocase subunit Sec61beta, partial [Ruminococcaceae bacterium]|nr:preprotein translocase subunit Sec61beta [Oscillospiraceae bacterium]